MKLFTFLATSLFLSSAFAVTNLQTCFSPDENCDQVIIDYMKTATKTLDMAIFSMTHNGIRDALLDAKSRGVKIRIVADFSQSQEKTTLLPTLVADGFNVRYGSQEGIMHNKFTIVDGQWIETGSYNYTYKASKYNTENQIYLNEAAVVSRYKADFEKIWSTGTKP